MGLFSKRVKEQSPPVNKKDLIPCDKAFVGPPKHYGKPQLPPKVTKEHFQLYKSMLEYFQDDKLQLPIDTTHTETLKPLTSRERCWLSRECLLRYLRASKWDLDAAIKSLKSTLVWRREVGLSLIDGITAQPLTSNLVSVENETGKQNILGFDINRRPLLYMKNGRQNTEPSFRQVQHLIYMMESVTTFTPQGVENITVLIDFKHYKEPGIITDKMPPLSIAKLCLNVMQNHYPERLGKCVLVNIPWFAWAFLKMMHPFLDPNTRQKTIFDEPFENHIDAAQLQSLYNGKLDFSYNHEVYWADLSEKVESLKKYSYERFLKFGGLVGLSEFDLKGDHQDLLYPVDYENLA